MTATAAWITARFSPLQIALFLLLAAVLAVITGVAMEHLTAAATLPTHPDNGHCAGC